MQSKSFNLMFLVHTAVLFERVFLDCLLQPSWDAISKFFKGRHHVDGTIVWEGKEKISFGVFWKRKRES